MRAEDATEFAPSVIECAKPGTASGLHGQNPKSGGAVNLLILNRRFAKKYGRLESRARLVDVTGIVVFEMRMVCFKVYVSRLYRTAPSTQVATV